MSGPTFIGLINNTALLLTLGMMYGFFLHKKGHFHWKLISGLALGLISIGLMMNPWQLAPGVFFDTRSILMSVGGLFLGTVPIIFAMLIGALYRIYAGGAGALTGVLWILCSGSLGLLVAKVSKKPAYRFSALELYLFGLFVQGVMLVLLLTMPSGMGIPIIRQVAVPTLLIFPLGSILLAKLLANQELQQLNKTKLDHNERKYRELVNHSQAIILRYDTEGRITFFNEFAQNLFGYRKEEIIGQSITDTLLPSDMPDKHNFHDLPGTFQHATEEKTEHESLNICKDGRRITVLWKSTPVLDPNGEAIGFQSVGHDVTEKHKAEVATKAAIEQFHRLIDISPIPLAILEDGQTFTYLNHRFTEVLGYTLEDLPSIDAWWDRAYPESQYRSQVQKKWLASVHQTRDQGTIFTPMETRVSCKNGTILDMIANLASIGGQEIVVLTDMSRERHLDRQKSAFIATATHELNTPLSSIMGFAEILHNDNNLDRATQKEYLDIILSKTETLEQIIDDLLALSKTESGRKVLLEKSTCDLGQLLEEILASYRVEYQTRDFRLDLSSAQNLKTLYLDRIKIGQVLDNLLSNAIKFSQDGSPIEIVVTSTGEEARIMIEDQGQGMSKEQVAKAFEKFYRVDMSDTATPGLGLGLSITKDIIEAHGGVIQIQSKPGSGTIVSFSLPLAPHTAS